MTLQTAFQSRRQKTGGLLTFVPVITGNFYAMPEKACCGYAVQRCRLRRANAFCTFGARPYNSRRQYGIRPNGIGPDHSGVCRERATTTGFGRLCVFESNQAYFVEDARKASSARRRNHVCGSNGRCKFDRGPHQQEIRVRLKSARLSSGHRLRQPA